jgi:hypothetical protein
MPPGSLEVSHEERNRDDSKKRREEQSDHRLPGDTGAEQSLPAKLRQLMPPFRPPCSGGARVVVDYLMHRLCHRTTCPRQRAFVMAVPWPAISLLGFAMSAASRL